MSNIKKKKINSIKTYLKKVFIIASIISVIISISILWISPILGEFSYSIDILSHFSLQITIVGILSTILLVVLTQKPIYFSLLGFILLPIIPHLPIGLVQSSNTNSNTDIYYVNMNWFNEDYNIIFTQIENSNPDLVVVLELRPELDTLLKEKYKSSIQTFNGALSCGIYTNQKILSSEVIKATYPICHMELKDYSIITVHPIPPFANQTWQDQKQNFMEVKGVYDKDRQNNKHPIIIGDFNSTTYSSLYNKSFGNFHEEKTNYSWNVHSVLSIPIDHVLSKDFEIDVNLLENSSDHSALLINLKN